MTRHRLERLKWNAEICGKRRHIAVLGKTSGRDQNTIRSNANSVGAVFGGFRYSRRQQRADTVNFRMLMNRFAGAIGS